jgi:ketosteroid isomerase-like protein
MPLAYDRPAPVACKKRSSGSVTRPGADRCSARSTAITRTMAFTGSATTIVIVLFLAKPARDTGRAMSQENVEVVRRIYAALDLSVPGSVSRFDGSPESIKGLIDPEIEWQGPREFPDLAETVHGYAGMARYGAKIAEVLDDYRMVPERFIDAGGDRVLVFSREGGRGRGQRAEVETHLTAHLWTLKDGKAVRMQSYWERADALEAVGLRE